MTKAATGTLYIVATPIGNLEDITLRALRILKEVDEIACEDTRQTKKLLAHFKFTKPLISYYQHNHNIRGPQLIEKMKNGTNIALVTDAGTPGISDPGTWLVAQSVEAGVPIVPIPGPSALISALSSSGVHTDRFLFQGFLPIKPGKRKAVLEGLLDYKTTLVFYEAGRRLHKLFTELSDVFGTKHAVIAREMTKIHEDFRRGPIHKILAKLPKEGLKGECVVMVDNR